MTMHDFSMTDKAGTNIGTFTGRTMGDALDSLAHAHDYWDHQDHATMAGGHLRHWTSDPALFATFERGLLVSLVGSQPEETPAIETGWPKTVEQIEAEADAVHDALAAAKERLAVAGADVARLESLSRTAQAVLHAAEA